ncbi:cell wall-associated serine proteinase [Clostridium putrefaciens]|uniref:Cell wall-associated serine proteinase n=1 Tax=Clostridium putrefaciens TaxID=99675 RepID=A0A381J8Q1_9CLOT|nr:S8 family serine peptidase [Clostridium putrefaciens]SUY47640.1 cell wall-associated serine proteinase [Clostridium putrefaciens]
MKNGHKRFLSSVLAFTVIFSSVITVSPLITNAKPLSENDKIIEAIKADFLKERQESIKEKLNSNEGSAVKENNPNEVVRVIVQMERDSTSDTKLKEIQTGIESKAKDLEGAEIRKTYTDAFNGFSMNVKRSEISKLKAIPGVKAVKEAIKYYPIMNNATKLTNAVEVWQKLNYNGEGLVISIIDTGLDVGHKDMKLTDTLKAKIQDIQKGEHTKFTSKVPYGHNFADNNDDVKPGAGVSQHGMHVAGIVSANGDGIDRFNSIKGVAPEAQLLAMKVFSNNPEISGCFDDDIIAAIDDSVKHGADIINMSLGSSAGFQDESSPVAVSIKNATDKGVMVVIAAGNDATSTDTSGGTTPIDKFGIKDTAMISSPASAEDSLAVASSDNSISINNNLSVNINGKSEDFNYYPSENDPAIKLKDSEYTIVDCGVGSEADMYNLQDELQGNIALIKYTGESTSSILRKGAMEHGAIGVIIYSNDGDETLHGMYEDKTLLPTAWIKNSAGKKIAEAVKGEAKVTFTGNKSEEVSVTSGQMSTFTSFGPTPNLELKPEISAPGGGIYSTVNDNKYDNMSGTSMAAPHIAGASALVMQGLKKSMPSLTGRELVEFSKKTLINTSKVQLDNALGSGVPYSPRRQGAGLANIENAINNTVLLTGENNKATVSVKEVGNNFSFKIKVKNYGSQLANYDLFTEGVLAQNIIDEDKHFADYIIEGAKTKFSKESISLKGQAEEIIEVNITLPSKLEKDRFVEGFVHLKGKSDNTPDLVIPYMGFCGDWGKESIIDKPSYEEGSISGYTTLTEGLFLNIPVCLGQFEESKDHGLKVDPETVAISPNGDDACDFAQPYLVVLRNAKNIKYDVVDKNDGTEKVLRALGDEDYLRKGMLAKQNAGAQMCYSGMWDGTFYNRSTGKYEVAKDGKYYIRVITKVDLPNAKPQVLYLPLKVDTEAPKVTILSAEKDLDGDTVTVKWTQKDEGPGASKLIEKSEGGGSYSHVYLNGERISEAEQAIAVEDDIYSVKIEVDNVMENSISIGARDSALNIGVDTITLGSVLSVQNLQDKMFINKSVVNDGVYRIIGTVSKDVKEVQINGEKANLTAKSEFSFDLKVKEGVNEIKIIAKDANGNVIEAITKNYKVTVDTEAPVIKITSPVQSGTEGIISNTDKVLIKGVVTDNESKPDKITVKVGWDTADVNSDGTFELETRLWDANNILEIVAQDEALNSTKTELSVGYENSTQDFMIKFTNLKSFTVIDPTQGEVKDGIYNAKGYVSKRINTLKIDGKDVVIKKDLTFEAPVSIDSIRKKVSVFAMDANGKVYYNYVYDILYDDKAPKINISEPIENADGNVYTNKDTLKIKGTAADDGFGYSLFINGNNILTLNQFPITGESHNKRDFEHEVNVSNNEKVLVQAKDLFGNAFLKEYNVIVDKEAPKVIIEGVEDGKVYNSSIKPEIKVNEDAATTMTLDGKAYLGTVIEEEGNHTLVVTAEDKSGNVSEECKVSFTIDKTAPEVTVTGVEEGKVYTEAVTPEVKANEKVTITMTLDEKVYDGTSIKELGKHTLVVTAVDVAGNKTEKTINFIIEEKKVDEDKSKDEDTKPGENKPKDEDNKPKDEDNKPKDEDNKPGEDKPKNEDIKSSSDNTKDNSNDTSVKASTSNGAKIPKLGSPIGMNELVVSGLIIIVIGGACIFVSRRKEKEMN